MRRLLLVNIFIFAVLASAGGLAYYGYSYTSEVSTRERGIIVDTMRELAEEKVVGIESQLSDTYDAVFNAIHLSTLADLKTLPQKHGAAIASIFVLDENLQPLPDGSVSSHPKEFSKFFLATILPQLPLQALGPRKRGHMHFLHQDADGRPYLFVFEHRTEGDRSYYVVLEADLNHLVGLVFPQFFLMRSPRLYQVVDAEGGLIYGLPFTDDAAGVVVEQPFSETVDKWRVRVTQRDAPPTGASNRRQIVDIILIGTALFVIVAGLGFLSLAIRRERRANELKSEFITNVSHELKTPLSIISMFGELLALGRTKSAGQATEYAEIIWRESVRLARLIDNVLDFAKIERGVNAYEFGEGDLGEVVSRAIELSQHRLAKAEMSIEADLDPDLPMVRLDANAFTLAVLNLIDNAIKYAPEGKRIAVGLHADGPHHVALSVKDWGPGIDPEEQHQIFERFYRAKAVRLKPIRGSGIGLALVEHITKAHHGQVAVASEPGKGATFTIRLPVVAADGPASRGRTGP
jgi:two-component system phosphate regulon sensor histidine kinase PhoR